MSPSLVLGYDQLKHLQDFLCKGDNAVQRLGVDSFAIVDSFGNRVDIDRNAMIDYLKSKVASSLKISTFSVRGCVSEYAMSKYNLVKFAASAEFEGMILTYAFLYDPQTKVATICSTLGCAFIYDTQLKAFQICEAWR